MLSEGKKAALCGAAAGVMNGLFGAGGGLVLTVLFRRFRLGEDKEIFATALGVMVPVSAAALAVLLPGQGAGELKTALPCCIGGLAGGLLGGLLFRRVPGVWLRRLMGGLILWGGLRLLL